jgi:hypothetical protein
MAGAMLRRAADHSGCRMFSLILGILVALNPAFSKQSRHQIQKSQSEWTWEVTWMDADKKKQSATWSMPAQALAEDLDEKTRFPMKAYAEKQEKAVDQYARSLPKKIKLKATRKGTRLEMRVRAPSRSKARETLEAAERVAEEAGAEFLQKHGYTTDGEGAILPDHARMVREYTEAVRPLADALAQGTSSPAEYAERALSFVQSIPYEKRKGGADVGYRRPLSLLGVNKGDCDSKSVLFLALMRARYPDVDSAIVTIPGHALVALQMEDERGDASIREGGETWVLAEPVGPAVQEVGETSCRHRRQARRGDMAMVDPD